MLTPSFVKKRAMKKRLKRQRREKRKRENGDAAFTAEPSLIAVEGVSGTEWISDGELRITESVLTRLGADDAGRFKHRRFRPLRAAMGPLIRKMCSAEQLQQMSGRDDVQVKDEATRREMQRRREMDAKWRDQTALRAKRLQTLASLETEGQGEDPADRILLLTEKSVVTDGGDGGSGGAITANGAVAKRFRTDVRGQSGGLVGSSQNASQNASQNVSQNVSGVVADTRVIRIPDGVAEMTSHEVIEAKKRREARPVNLNTAIQCYTCKRPFTKLHFFYDSLCPDCAELNFRKRHQRANLKGKYCLVTGARVKIGFRCALILLRAGATVVATTRFPKDAARRYAAQDDAKDWTDRLHIYGADFRDALGVERLCAHLIETLPKLHIIVNNACQTIRRPASYYKHLLPIETAPAQTTAAKAFLQSFERARREGRLETGAAANVLGIKARERTARIAPAQNDSSEMGALGTSNKPKGTGDDDDILELEKDSALTHTDSVTTSSEMRTFAAAESALLSQVCVTEEDASAEIKAQMPTGHVDINGQQVDLRKSNSWMLHLHEVSTGEMAEVLAINTIAPFVINARLRPLMRRDTTAMKFIINVSAMEGKFYRYKSARHPHTNMAKAALNMMTRTSAQDYVKDKIYMTAVDTGWINDEKPRERAEAHMKKHKFQTPLDEVDAAARVLDPAMAPYLEEQQGIDRKNIKPHWGIFLKDYCKSEW